MVKVEANIDMRANLPSSLSSFAILDIAAFVVGVGFHLFEGDQDIWVFVHTGIQNIIILVVPRMGCPAHAVQLRMIPVLERETEGILRSILELWAS